jgi:uncharacterized protein (UPF0210 family)
MGIRRGDDALYDRVEKAIARNRADIAKILKDYGVPVLDRKASVK